jgi:hypothetical protein
VNGWGFKRITEGPDLNSYYHEMFLRGLPQVCAKMRRPQKGQGAHSQHNKDSSGNLGQAPDFYKISMFAPLPPLEDEEAKPLSSSSQQHSSSPDHHKSAPKTPERPVKSSSSSAAVEPDVNSSSAVTNDSSGSTGHRDHQRKDSRVKINDTDSKEDSAADNIDNMDEEEDDISDDNNKNKPKVTPTRPEPKVSPSTPKLYMTSSPAYAPSRAPQSPGSADSGTVVHGVLLSDQQYNGSTLSPTDMGREFVELPTSAGNSVTSWTNSPSEEDLMFGGNMSLANAFSPHSNRMDMLHSNDQQHMLHLQQQQQQHHPYYHPHHLHPAMLQHHRGGGGGRHPSPLPNFPQSDGGGIGPRASLPPRGSFDGIPPMVDSNGDGLSEADLSYLTFQNRILLSQATRSSTGGAGGASASNSKSKPSKSS